MLYVCCLRRGVPPTLARLREMVHGLTGSRLLFGSIPCGADFGFFYWFYLRLHHDGRLLDLYLRLTQEEPFFFLPHDNEVSAKELKKLVVKSEKWRGAKGERRKVVVHDYIFEGGNDSEEAQTVTSVAMYELSLNGENKPYRNFLIDNGAIREILGEPISKLLRNCEFVAELQH